MMFPNPKMTEHLKLQQCWEFRRKEDDTDSSSNNSKSSAEPALKKHKLISSFMVDHDETNDNSMLQQNSNYNPVISEQMNPAKAENARRRRSSKKDDAAQNETKKGARKPARGKKSKPSTNEQAIFDDLKKYMNFLLEDLKVSRENLLKWMREEMQKLVAEETGAELETREDSFKGEKVQLQHQTNIEENPQYQHQNHIRKNITAPNLNNLPGFGQVQNHDKLEENVHVQQQQQQQVHFKEKNEVHHLKNSKKNNFLYHRNPFGPYEGAQNYFSRHTERLGKTNKSTDFNSCKQALGDQVDYNRAVFTLTPTNNDGEERMTLSAKSNSKSCPSDQNVQDQQPKSIVLGIRAQNCNGGSSERSSKGRKTTDSNNQHQVPGDQSIYSKPIGFMTSAEKDKGGRMALSVEPKFSTDFSSQIAPSMYLTLPTVLTKHNVANHPFDTPSFSSIQPRLARSQIGTNSERSNLVLGSSSHHGFFQGMQPAERSRNFTQMSSRDISYFNKNSTVSSIPGNGFPSPFLQSVAGSYNIPSQVDLENLPRESNMPDLNMNEEAMRFPGGSYSFSEQFLANNFLSHSSYKAEGKLIPYQDGYQFPK